jgi:hypothetical protein
MSSVSFTCQDDGELPHPQVCVKCFLYCFTERLHSSFIFYSGGQVAVVSTDFDLALLYTLTRNLLTSIPAPTCGWGNSPSSWHVNETDDIGAGIDVKRFRVSVYNKARSKSVETTAT